MLVKLLEKKQKRHRRNIEQISKLNKFNIESELTLYDARFDMVLDKELKPFD